jgi:hypothetical protein
MSVLGAGAVGYDDYQRIANYDSEVLYSFVAPPSSSSLQSPVLPVLRWSYLEGTLAPTVNPSALQFVWTSDAAGIDVVGTRQFIVAPAIANPLQFRLSNLGPYVNFEQVPVGGLNWGCAGSMSGGNRQSLLEAIPTQSVLIDQQAIAIAGNGQATIYPTDYYAGPMSVWFYPQFATGSLVLLGLTPANTWDNLNVYNNTVANPIVPLTWIAPFGAWRILVGNTTAGASTFYLAVTASATGAA